MVAVISFSFVNWRLAIGVLPLWTPELVPLFFGSGACYIGCFLDFFLGELYDGHFGGYTL